MIIKKETITSKNNPTVSYVSSLSEKKYRDRYGVFRTDGIKLAEEIFKRGISPEMVLLKESAKERMLSRFSEYYFEAIAVSDAVFDRISEEKSPEGVICTAKYIDKFQKKITIYNSADFLHAAEERIVLLESVRDPSNVGAIVRSAAALGVDRLVISADCADIYHPKAVRASMGTLFGQRIDRVENFASAITALRESGRRVFAAALSDTAVLLDRSSLTVGDCVVIGNEGHGLSEETVALCDGAVMIPMSPRAESFNAAVAASILMWEFARAELLKK